MSKGEYQNGGLALILIGDEHGELVTVASINVPEFDLPEGTIFIKDWSENAGILETLENAGVIKDTGETVPSGFVNAKLCTLIIDPESLPSFEG